MVYDSTYESYENFLNSLEDIFNRFEIEDEYLTEETTNFVSEQVKTEFFNDDMIPPYDKRDIIEILNYYASQSVIPEFYTFDQIDRQKLDVGMIAEELIKGKYDAIGQYEYIESIWKKTDKNILNIFYSNNFDLFETLVQKEIRDQIKPPAPIKKIIYETRRYEELTLEEYEKYLPIEAKELKDKIYEKSKDEEGNYTCQLCLKKSKSRFGFEIDHKIPMNEGGLTEESNLQVLCRHCNRVKSDKI